MAGVETEVALQKWRYGQPQAERLVAAILHLENYHDVDPQHPLGGPDGLKDVMCRKGKLRWVAAAYFPATEPSFSGIQSKFDEDSRGVVSNGAQGFAFFVNQPLTVGERNNLISRSPASQTEIYHLERIARLLDSPKGCGLRLEYLRIAMTESEQWAFWSTMNANVVFKLIKNEKRRDSQIERLDRKLDLILRQTKRIGSEVADLPSALGGRVRLAPVWAEPAENPEMPTASLSLTTLCWLHRLLTEDLGLPESVRGRFRSIQVWVGGNGSPSAVDAHHPPPPTKVIELTAQLLSWWRAKHPQLKTSDRATVIVALAEFHHRFLAVHPFVDANGRVARAVLDQAARELLNQSVGSGFTSEPGEYYLALAEADKGNLDPLRDRVRAALE